MAVSVDALNLATIHLMPKLENLFFDEHVFFKEMIENGVDKRPSGGEYAAFDVVIDGPGNISKQINGTEAYSYGRRNIVRQARVYIPTHIYAFAVEGEALRHAQGVTGIENLLKMYPEQAMLDFKQRINSQILTGDGAAANVDGFATLDGDATYNPDGTALNGVLDFATVAAQVAAAETVFNLAKSTDGWQNQYGNVTSFATNGKRLARDVYGQCEVRGGPYGAPTLGLSDAATYNNLYDSLDDQVRYSAPSKTTGEDGRFLKEGLMFHQQRLYNDPAMDDAAAGDHGVANGTWYMLNPKTWFILTLGKDDKMETKGFFDTRGPFKLEGRDAWGFEIVTSWQIACRFLKANGALEGTAIL